jgi:phage terminase small subunit
MILSNEYKTNNAKGENMKQLTDKQMRFVELYNGNATETAQIVGYSNPRIAGQRLLKDVAICSLIQERRKKEIKSDVLDRQARQKFWSDTVTNDDEDMKNRLKASELLGKSEGDFLDRVENSGEITLNIKWAD